MKKMFLCMLLAFVTLLNGVFFAEAEAEIAVFASSMPLATASESTVDSYVEIPDLGVSVGLVDVVLPLQNGTTQDIIDRPETGIRITTGLRPGTMVIGDHASQGFDVIYDAEPGMSVYVIQDDGTEEEFVVAAIDRDASNSGKASGFRFSDGERVWDCGAPLILYTCNPNCHGESVTVVTCERAE